MKMFYKKFKAAREAAGLTQDDIAAVCIKKDGIPISRAAVAQWEKEEGTVPILPYLVAAAKEMKCSIDWLTGLSGDMELKLPQSLITAYQESSEEGRAHISKVAEREAEYSTAEPKKTSSKTKTHKKRTGK